MPKRVYSTGKKGMKSCLADVGNFFIGVNTCEATCGPAYSDPKRYNVARRELGNALARQFGFEPESNWKINAPNNTQLSPEAELAFQVLKDCTTEMNFVTGTD